MTGGVWPGAALTGAVFCTGTAFGATEGGSDGASKAAGATAVGAAFWPPMAG